MPLFLRRIAATATLFLLLLIVPVTHGKQFVVGVSGQSLMPLAEEVHRRVAAELKIAMTDVRTVSVPAAPADLALFLATGPDIDVLLVPYQTGRSLFDADMVVSLDEPARSHVGLGQTLATVHNGVQSTARWQGQWIGVPLYATLRIIGLNHDHLAEAGLDVSPHWTWDEFAVAGQRLNARQAGSAVLCTLPDCWLPFVWSHGGGYVNDTVDALELTRPESGAAFAWLQQTVRNGSVVLRPGFVGAGLAHGTLSMVPADSTEHRVRAASGGDEPLTYVPFPKSSATNESVSIVSGPLYVVNRNTDITPDLMNFLAQLLGAAAQDAVVQAGFYSTNKQSQRLSQQFGLADTVLYEALAAARALPLPTKGDVATWQPVNDYITAYLQGTMAYDVFVGQVAEALQLP